MSVSFVDDTDLIIEGKNAESKIQEIINIYESLYAATGGKIEGEKTKFYAWKLMLRQGRKILYQVKVNLKVNDLTLV